jgi:hypothetical protein
MIVSFGAPLAHSTRAYVCAEATCTAQSAVKLALLVLEFFREAWPADWARGTRRIAGVFLEEARSAVLARGDLLELNLSRATHWRTADILDSKVGGASRIRNFKKTTGKDNRSVTVHVCQSGQWFDPTDEKLFKRMLASYQYLHPERTSIVHRKHKDPEQLCRDSSAIKRINFSI